MSTTRPTQRRHHRKKNEKGKCNKFKRHVLLELPNDDYTTTTTTTSMTTMNTMNTVLLLVARSLLVRCSFVVRCSLFVHATTATTQPIDANLVEVVVADGPNSTSGTRSLGCLLMDGDFREPTTERTNEPQLNMTPEDTNDRAICVDSSS